MESSTGQQHMASLKKLTGQDLAVMNTSNDALMTKVNAASLGYFKDDYSQYFLKTKKKMFPIINRGTWTRVFAVRQVMERFLKAYSSKVKNGEIETIQIVGLGAGFDTSYFWIRDLVASGQLPEEVKSSLVYIEVDFPEVVEKKIQTIQKIEALWKHLWASNEEIKPEEILSNQCLNTANYKLFSADIRESQTLSGTLLSLGVKQTSPTLLLTECVLVYLKPDDTRQVLTFVKDFFQGDKLLLNYEMIRPNDPFGRVMLENLEDRGCRLQGIHECPTEESQNKRMLEVAGMANSECHNMCTVYSTKLERTERLRIEKIEIFDEFEEWELLQSHYCLCLGSKIADPDLSKLLHI